MPLTLHSQVEGVPINLMQPLVYHKDAIGAVLSTSLYAASTPSSKTHSDDQAIVGATKEGYPFLLCIDGFYGCHSTKVFGFIKQQVVPMIEIYQNQLQQGESPEKISHAWQSAIFQAKKDYLNQGIDFTLAIVVTFRLKNACYASGWSVGDIGLIYKPLKGAVINLLPMSQVNGFKDGFDDAICQDTSAQKAVIKRSGWFILPVEPGDEIVAYTYLPKNLVLSDKPLHLDEKTQVTLAKLDITQCDPTIPDALEQLWQTIKKAHALSLEQIKNQTNYRLGDDCTLCKLRIPHALLRQSLKREQLIQELEEQLSKLQPKTSMLTHVKTFLKLSQSSTLSVMDAATHWLASLKTEHAPLSNEEKELLKNSCLGHLWKEMESWDLEDEKEQSADKNSEKLEINST